MNKYIKLTFLLFLALYSCEKKIENNYRKLIVGNWLFEKESPKRKNLSYSDFGYTFSKSGDCECKPGFYEEKERNKDEDRKTIFYGTKTKYKVINDSLYIKNLLTKKWDAAKIISITSKSLKVSFEKNIILVFSKQNYIENENDGFDKIIISKSPCFGSCPVNDVEINQNGSLIYYGGHWNIKNGHFKSKITPKEFKEIENSFKQTRFLELNNDYSANWTDDQEVTVTFVKDNKILKTVRDYGRQSPKLFRITLEPITFLYQKLKLVEDKSLEKFQENRYFTFEKGNKIINLKSSEDFYLSNLLNNAKISTKIFNVEYIINYPPDFKIFRIETDGQFYKVIMQNKSSVTLDIGFNFIEINNLKERLEPNME